MSSKIEIGKFARVIFLDEVDDTISIFDDFADSINFFNSGLNKAMYSQLLATYEIFGYNNFEDIELADQCAWPHKSSTVSHITKENTAVPFGKLCLVTDKFIGNNYIWYQILFDGKTAWVTDTKLNSTNLEQKNLSKNFDK